MESKYIIFNYDDLTDASQKHLENVLRGGAKNITSIELQEGKTGYMFNKKPF